MLLNEPTFLDDLCAHISDGGTLNTFVRIVHDIRFMSVWEWLDEDPARRERYNKAVGVQGEVHRDLVTDGLVDAATYDIAQLFDPKGRPLPIHQVSPWMRANIAGIETTVNEAGSVTTKYRMVDKTKNRELLGKRYGMFVDKIEHGGRLTLEQMVAASMSPGSTGMKSEG